MSSEFSDISDDALASLLKDGGIGVLPTDTVYGLVCVAANEQAVKRLYALKQRESKPGTLIAANIDQLVKLGFTRRYLKAVEEFWPGAVSIEQPCSNPALVYLNQGTGRQAVRVVADDDVKKLLEKIGPLLTSSANQPGKKPATNITEAKAYFHEDVDFYVDGGDFSKAEPSTLIRIVDDAVEVLREGAVKIRS